MATRHERVVLTLEDNFTTSAAKAAAATALINRELKSLSGQAVQTHRPLRATAGEVEKVATASSRGQKDIDRFSGRLSLLRDVAAVLGPSLVPIGAVAVPAIAGLASGFGAAALAGGTMIAAFQGVGESLEAVNKAALEPTADNIEAARLALQSLSPEARRFVGELQNLRPALTDLRDAASEGFFPGLILGMRDMEEVLPRVEGLLFRIGGAAGQLGDDLGEALASREGREFLNFLRQEVPPTIVAFGQAVGSLTSGLGELWMAFTPLNRDFTVWLRDAAEGFDQWAAGLAQTEGFADFVDYIRTNGPLVAEALGNIGNAVLQIVEAAAPLGGPVLQSLSAVADVIASIAGSDAGPAIMGTVTALALLNRSMKGFEAIQATTWGAAVKGADTFAGKVAASRTPLLRSGAAMAGLALASSDTAQGFALSNTASMALLGTLGGPWGAAVGGAIGLMLDLSATSDKYEVNAEELSETLNRQTGAVTENTTVWVANQLQKNGALDAAQALGISLDDVTQAALGNEEAMAAVVRGLEAAKSGFYDAAGRAVVGREALQDYQYDSYAVEKAIGLTNGALDASQEKFRQMAEATGETKRGYEDATTAAQDFREELIRVNKVLEGRAGRRDYEQALDDFFARAEERAAVLGELAQAEKDLANADTGSERKAARGRIEDLKEQLELLKSTLNIDTQAGRDTQAALDQIASSANEVAQNLGRIERRQFLRQARQDLIAAAESLGKTRDEAKALADRLLALDRQKARPKIELNDGSARAKMEQIDRDLKGLTDEPYTIRVNTVYTESGRRFKDVPSGVPGFATGGFTGDVDPWRVAGVVHGREVVIPEWLVRRDASYLRSRYGFLPGMNNLPGYRSGGYVDSRSYDQRSYSSAAGSTSVSASLDIDYGRLAAELSRVRPVYGDVTVSGDPAAFKRMVEQDRRSKAGGGI